MNPNGNSNLMPVQNSKNKKITLKNFMKENVST